MQSNMSWYYTQQIDDIDKSKTLIRLWTHKRHQTCHHHGQAMGYTYFIEDWNFYYHKTSNISCTLVGNKIVDHSDVVGASRRCSNYIFILYLTPGFSGLGNNNCKTGQETFKFWDLVHLMIANWRYAQCQALPEPNDDLSIQPLGININEICINIHTIFLSRK